jgi:hypothetical protein
MPGMVKKSRRRFGINCTKFGINEKMKLIFDNEEVTAEEVTAEEVTAEKLTAEETLSPSITSSPPIIEDKKIVSIDDIPRISYKQWKQQQRTLRLNEKRLCRGYRPTLLDTSSETALKKKIKKKLVWDKWWEDGNEEMMDLFKLFTGFEASWNYDEEFDCTVNYWDIATYRLKHICMFAINNEWTDGLRLRGFEMERIDRILHLPHARFMFRDNLDLDFLNKQIKLWKKDPTMSLERQNELIKYHHLGDIIE